MRFPRSGYVQLVKKHAGDAVAAHVAGAWSSLASRLKDYRDLIAHFNPLIVPVPRFTSTNGEAYDGLDVQLPLNPEAKQRTDLGFVPGDSAIPYCTSVRESVLGYANQLLVLLERGPR